MEQFVFASDLLAQLSLRPHVSITNLSHYELMTLARLTSIFSGLSLQESLIDQCSEDVLGRLLMLLDKDILLHLFFNVTRQDLLKRLFRVLPPSRRKMVMLGIKEKDEGLYGDWVQWMKEILAFKKAKDNHKVQHQTLLRARYSSLMGAVQNPRFSIVQIRSYTRFVVMMLPASIISTLVSDFLGGFFNDSSTHLQDSLHFMKGLVVLEVFLQMIPFCGVYLDPYYDELIVMIDNISRTQDDFIVSLPPLFKRLLRAEVQQYPKVIKYNQKKRYYRLLKLMVPETITKPVSVRDVRT